MPERCIGCTPREIFATYDQDGDNLVDEEEFFDWLLTKDGKGGSRSLWMPPDAPMQVHLSMMNDTTFTVTWVTKYETEDVPIVRFALAAGPSNCTGVALNSEAAGTTSTYEAGVFGWHGWIHRVWLEDLSPATWYCYQVGNANSKYGFTWSTDVFSFHTPPLPQTVLEEPVVAAIYGDMGTFMPLGFRVTNQMIQDVEASQPFDAIVHVGDIAYAGTGSTREFEGIWDLYGNQVQPLAAYMPQQTTVGNHEKYYNYTSFRSRYKMPGYETEGMGNFYFSYNYGPIHFTSMCTENVFSYAPGSAQYGWIEQDLAAADANREERPWVVLLGHRPMYSSDEQSDSGDLRVDIEPLLKKYNVDLYVAGHMHEYERTYPVYNNTPTATPAATSTEPTTTTYVNPTATTHLTIGTAGALVLERWVNPQPTWSAFREERYGYGTLAAYNATHLQFQFKDLYHGLSDDLWIVRDQ